MTKISKIHLNDKQRDSVNILVEWLAKLYKEGDVKNTYSLFKWVVGIKSNKIITHTELEVLRDIWDTYVEYKKEELNE